MIKQIKKILHLPRIDFDKLQSMAFSDDYYKSEKGLKFSVLEDAVATYYSASISIREPDQTSQIFYIEAFDRSEIIKIIENNLKSLKKEGYFDLGYYASIKISKHNFTYSKRIDNINHD